jgi:hypothetical protein
MCAWFTALRVFALAAGSLGAFLPADARGEPGAPSAVAGRPSDPITLMVDVPAGSPLDPARLQSAIARELGTLVVREPGGRGGTLVVRQDGAGVNVSFEGPSGRHDARTIALGADASQAEQEIALVAVNVARDQTAALLQGPLRARGEVTPVPVVHAAAAPPAPPPPRAHRCPPVAEGGSLPAGIDFAPFAGTSSFAEGRSGRVVSLGLLGAYSRGVEGAAVSGLANVDVGPVCGVEIAGLTNVDMGVRGAQIAGLANVGAAVQGAQIAGLANVATSSRGAQIAGLVDVSAGDSAGLQLAPINVSAGRIRGVQIGLVNVASDADAQIGLINVDLHGRTTAEAWAEPEAGTLVLGLLHGSRHFHTIYGIEMQAETGRPWAVFALGARLTPDERLHVDLDLLEHTQLLATSVAPNQIHEIRVVIGYALASHLAVFAGPTFNVLAATNLPRADAPSYALVLGDTPSAKYRGWPGVTLGLEGP